MAEIHNAQGQYVGYVTRNGEIRDTRRGGLGGATLTAGARGARRNPAMRAQIARARR